MCGNAELIKKKYLDYRKKTWCYENFSNICMNYVLFEFDFWCLLLVQQSSVMSSIWEDYYYYYYYYYYEVFNLNALHGALMCHCVKPSDWLTHATFRNESSLFFSVRTLRKSRVTQTTALFLSLSFSYWSYSHFLPHLFLVCSSPYSRKARLFLDLHRHCNHRPRWHLRKFGGLVGCIMQ